MFGRKISFKEKAKKAYDDFLEESKEGIAEKRLYFSTGHDAMDYDVNLERFEKEYGYRQPFPGMVQESVPSHEQYRSRPSSNHGNSH